MIPSPWSFNLLSYACTRPISNCKTSRKISYYCQSVHGEQMVGNGTPWRGFAGQWIPEQASQEDSLRPAQSQQHPWHRATIPKSCTKTVMFAIRSWPQWEIAEDLCSLGSKAGLQVPGNTQEVSGAGQIQIRIHSVCMRSTDVNVFTYLY